MRKIIFSFVLLGLCTTTSLSAQNETKESLRYEIENLREQIAIIIRNNNSSLMEMDDRLTAAKGRIRNLETENSYLRQKTRTRGEILSSLDENPAMQSALSKIARLERDNKFLRESLDLEKKESRRDAQNMVNRLNLLETQKHHLLNLNDSLNRIVAMSIDAKTWQNRFQEAEDKVIKLEVENTALWQQARQSKAAHNREMEKQEAFVGRLEQQLGAVETRNVELEAQMKANLAFVRKTVNEKEALVLQNTRYQRTIDSLETANAKVQNNLRYEPMTEKLHQKMDSLAYENTSLKRQVAILNSGEAVKQSRIRDLEVREADVREALFRMEIREQLMRDREKEALMKQQELEMKELKYQGLDEKEVRLKMIEARLREAVREDSRN
jgi:hypothetical protein